MSTFYDLSVVDEINVKLLKPCSAPLRSNLGSLEDLTESIRQHGLLQPLIVRPRLDGFELVAGNRRFAACRQLRWQKVPCIVRDITDREAFELSLTENVQRESLNPMDEAEEFQRYVFGNGWGIMGELARRLGKSPGYVSQRVSLLKLPKRIRALIAAGRSASVPLERSHEPNMRSRCISSPRSCPRAAHPLGR